MLKKLFKEDTHQFNEDAKTLIHEITNALTPIYAKRTDVFNPVELEVTFRHACTVVCVFGDLRRIHDDNKPD